MCSLRVKKTFEFDDFKNAAKFMLMVVPIRDPKKYHGWLPGKGLYLMARIFDAIEVAISSTTSSDMDFALGTKDEKRSRMKSEAWLEACVEFVAAMVADKAMIHGMLLHAPPSHALEVVGSSALMRVVIDQKYFRGPIYAFYFEFVLYIVLLLFVTTDLSIWSDPAWWTLATMVVLCLYFTWRMVQHMWVMRAQELETLPTNLGFDKNKVPIDNATPFKIIFVPRYRNKFLQGQF